MRARGGAAAWRASKRSSVDDGWRRGMARRVAYRRNERHGNAESVALKREAGGWRQRARRNSGGWYGEAPVRLRAASNMAHKYDNAS
jgi:hypothetical protein